MDRLESLRVFVAVAEARGFAVAARKLGLSPPAVTRAVLALEQHLGAQLLHRTTRAVQLTEVGERFMGDCRRILSDLEEAEASASGAYAEPKGRLSITASSMFGRMHVTPIVLELLARCPHVTVRTFFVDRIVHLLDEGFDVAVRIAHLPDSSLTAVRVGAVRRVAVASPDYLARRGTPKSIADLERHDGIGFSATGSGEGPWAFYPPGQKRKADKLTVTPDIRLSANASEVAILAALAGRGIARVLSYQVHAELQSGRLRAVLPDMEPEPIPVHLVFPSGRNTAAKVRAFVDLATSRLRNEPVLREAD